jgi:hypothetical protein
VDVDQRGRISVDARSADESGSAEANDGADAPEEESLSEE